MRTHRPPGFLYRSLEPLWSRLLHRCPEERLINAVRANNLVLVRDLLEFSGWDCNAPLLTIQPSDRGHKDFRLLHLAASEGLFEMVELLLSLGADLTIKTSWHISPMHLAAQNKHVHIVALLAESGGQVLERFPCLSTYWEEDPYTPTSLEILRNMGHRENYSGDEHRRYRAHREGTLLQTITPASNTLITRARL